MCRTRNAPCEYSSAQPAHHQCTAGLHSRRQGGLSDNRQSAPTPQANISRVTVVIHKLLEDAEEWEAETPFLEKDALARTPHRQLSRFR